MNSPVGRYSKLSATGVRVRAARERVLGEQRSEPWQPSMVTELTRVRRMAPAQISAMVADYHSGIGSWRLARKYGVSSSTVLARLKAAGVELDVVHTQQVERQVGTDEMRRLRGEGWTLTAIGKQFGLTRQAVAMRLKRAAS